MGTLCSLPGTLPLAPFPISTDCCLLPYKVRGWALPRCRPSLLIDEVVSVSEMFDPCIKSEFVSRITSQISGPSRVAKKIKIIICFRENPNYMTINYSG